MVNFCCHKREKTKYPRGVDLGFFSSLNCARSCCCYHPFPTCVYISQSSIALLSVNNSLNSINLILFAFIVSMTIARMGGTEDDSISSCPSRADVAVGIDDELKVARKEKN